MFGDSEGKFASEWNVFDRVASIVDKYGFATSDIKEHRKIMMRSMTPEEKLGLSMIEASKRLESIKNLSDPRMVLDYALERISYPQFYNAPALLLGYYVCGDDKVIDIDRFNRATDAVSAFYPGEIAGTDILRYARWWCKK